jgi:hypothetical protein
MTVKQLGGHTGNGILPRVEGTDGAITIQIVGRLCEGDAMVVIPSVPSMLGKVVMGPTPLALAA